MSSIFTKIINKEIRCFKIAENDFCIAFLDLYPIKKGHTLVVPKLEVDLLFHLPKKNYFKLMDFSYQIARSIQETISCKRVGLAVLGLEIPHAHIHLIPLDKESDFNFQNPKLDFTIQEMKDIAKKISKNL